jgi:hypothetical protein
MTDDSAFDDPKISRCLTNRGSEVPILTESRFGSQRLYAHLECLGPLFPALRREMDLLQLSQSLIHLVANTLQSFLKLDELSRLKSDFRMGEVCLDELNKLKGNPNSLSRQN